MRRDRSTRVSEPANPAPTNHPTRLLLGRSGNFERTTVHPIVSGERRSEGALERANGSGIRWSIHSHHRGGLLLLLLVRRRSGQRQHRVDRSPLVTVGQGDSRAAP